MRIAPPERSRSSGGGDNPTDGAHAYMLLYLLGLEPEGSTYYAKVESTQYVDRQILGACPTSHSPTHRQQCNP